MNLEQLKKMLQEGKITQEAFDYLSKNFLSDDDGDDGDKPKGGDDKKDDKEPNGDDDDDALERKIQSIVDRATNKLGNENKRLKEQLEKMKKEKMTDDERKEYEFAEKEKEIQERESRLKAQENRLYAIKAIKKAGLDDGSDASLDLVDFVVADDEEGIDKRVKAFNNLVKKFVQAEVERTFKKNGGKPAKGGETGGEDNPYAKETFNLTKQMRLEMENPELAKRLRDQAGM